MVLDFDLVEDLRRREVVKKHDIHINLSVLAFKCVTPQSRGVLLTTRQPAEYSWMLGNSTPLMKIGQSILCTGSSTQIKLVPNSLQ